MREEIKKEIYHLVNEVYPKQAKLNNWPVCENHCFLRIIYDNIFNDCWYKHLDKNKTVLDQLDNIQLLRALRYARMLSRKINFLNQRSLGFRKIYRTDVRSTFPVKPKAKFCGSQSTFVF